MTQTLEALTRQTKTLTSIRSIVHMMKTMSAINAAPYEHASHAIGAYQRTVREGFHAFFHRTGPLKQDIARVTTHVVIVFGSDHGLCGNYNEALATEVAAHMSEPRATGVSVRVVCVGAQMSDALGGLSIEPDVVLLSPASVEGIGPLAGDLVMHLDTMRHDSAFGGLSAMLCFTRRAEQGKRETRLSALLPLASDLTEAPSPSGWASRSLPDFTMPPHALLAALIRSHIYSSVYHAAAEALVTENDARLTRMQQAEQSVDDRLDEVRSETRFVRQSEITAELLDVIIGFEMLNDANRKKRRGESREDDD